MKLKKYPPNPNQGIKKTTIKFAWFPTKVENKLIWLEKYKEVWAYKRITIRLIGGTPLTGDMWRLESTELYSKPGLPGFKNPPPHPNHSGSLQTIH